MELPTVVTALALATMPSAQDRAQQHPENQAKRLVATWQGHEASVHAISLAPDGRRAVTASEDGTLRIWNVATGEATRVCATGDRVWAAAFLPSGDRVVAGGYDGRLTLWDAGEGTRIAAFGAEPDGWRGITTLVLSADGKHALTGGFDATMRLWDLTERKVAAEWKGHADTVFAVGFGPGANRVCSGSFDGTLRIVDREKGECVAVLAESDEEKRGWKRAMLTTGDGRLFVAGAAVPREWRATDGTSHDFTGEPHTESSVSIAISPDGRTLATGGFDGHLHLWDVATRAGRARWPAEQGDGVWAVAFLPDGRLLSAGNSGAVKLWETGVGAKEAEQDKR